MWIPPRPFKFEKVFRWIFLLCGHTLSKYSVTSQNKCRSVLIGFCFFSLHSAQIGGRIFHILALHCEIYDFAHDDVRREGKLLLTFKFGSWLKLAFGKSWHSHCQASISVRELKTNLLAGARTAVCAHFHLFQPTTYRFFHPNCLQDIFLKK